MLKKKIIIVLVWVLIISPLQIAMASVGGASVSGVEGDNPAMQSQATLQTSGEHHNKQDCADSSGHSNQEHDCSGCNACAHCIHAIGTEINFIIQSLNTPLTSFLVPHYQVDNSTAFRPPRHS